MKLCCMLAVAVLLCALLKNCCQQACGIAADAAANQSALLLRRLACVVSAALWPARPCPNKFESVPCTSGAAACFAAADAAAASASADFTTGLLLRICL
jgi:hypothetical protein